MGGPVGCADCSGGSDRRQYGFSWILLECCEAIVMNSCATTIFALAVILGLSGTARAQATPAHAALNQLAWLAGTWSGGTSPLAFEERWTPAAGGAMLAVSRTLKGDRMVAFEFLRIIERDGGLVYVAQPNGRPPTEF